MTRASLSLKLVFAQLPLGSAMALVGYMALNTIGTLGAGSEAILKDNYRSILATERMEAALDQIEEANLLADRYAEQKPAISSFEQALEIQEGNVTEPGEGELTAKLRAEWQALLTKLPKASTRANQQPATQVALLFDFNRVRLANTAVLNINQDAMVEKSELARRVTHRRETMMLLALFAAFVMGIYGSVSFTRRLLRPLGVLGQAARRLGSGDFAARAKISGHDEISALAQEFNQMATSLANYRNSSLGELLQAQQATQAAIDSLPDPVLILDLAGSLVGYNRQADLLLRVSSLAKDGPIADRLPPAVGKTVSHAASQVQAGRGAYVPKGYDEAVRLQGSDGEHVLLVRATPLHEADGSLSGLTVLLQDITRVRRLDELRNDFVATVAHEFRTPLTSLRMMIYIFRESAVGELNEKQRDLVEGAREDCERLQRLVDELLETSKLEAAAPAKKQIRLQAHALINEALNRYERMATEKQVRLVTHVSPFLPEVVADPDRLPLAFDNLLTNAIRYTPRGGAVSLSAEVQNHEMCFKVSDQGPGIAEEHQGHIFDKFFRVPDPRTSGAGLGLYIAKEVVRSQGGQIGLQSQPGQGSTFWFTVPLADNQSPPSVS